MSVAIRCGRKAGRREWVFRVLVKNITRRALTCKTHHFLNCMQSLWSCSPRRALAPSWSHGSQHPRPQGLARGGRPRRRRRRSARQGARRETKVVTDQLMLSALARREHHRRRLWTIHRPGTAATVPRRQSANSCASRPSSPIARQADLVSAPNAQPSSSNRIQSVDATARAATSCISSDSRLPEANADKRKILNSRSTTLHRTDSAAAPPMPFRESLDQIDRPQTRERRRLRADDRIAVLDRCDDDAKPRIFATSRRS